MRRGSHESLPRPPHAGRLGRTPVRVRSGRRRSRGDARQCAWKPHITVAPPGPMANRGPRAATFTRGTLNHRHLNIPEPLCKRLGNGFGETTRPACRRCILESAASPVVSQRGSFVIENVGDNGRGCHRRVGGRRLRDRRGYRRSGENGSYGTEHQDSGDDDRSLYAHDSSMGIFRREQPPTWPSSVRTAPVRRTEFPPVLGYFIRYVRSKPMRNQDATVSNIFHFSLPRNIHVRMQAIVCAWCIERCHAIFNA